MMRVFTLRVGDKENKIKVPEELRDLLTDLEAGEAQLFQKLDPA